jgi:peptidoglycan LD-endopeptidase CwlK
LHLSPDQILFTQRILKLSGFNPGPLDGIWGPRTEAAFHMFDSTTRKIAKEEGKFDQRSESNIRTLIPTAQRAARRFLKLLKRRGINAKIISGTRSYAEQNFLYAQGRRLPGPIVTKAKGGQSNHNFGIAWDIGIFADGKTYLPESPLYKRAGQLAKQLNIEWGGTWKKFRDEPHFQLKTGLTDLALRSRFEKGTTLV